MKYKVYFLITLLVFAIIAVFVLEDVAPKAEVNSSTPARLQAQVNLTSGDAATSPLNTEKESSLSLRASSETVDSECYRFSYAREASLNKQRTNYFQSLQHSANQDEQINYVIYGDFVLDDKSALEQENISKFDALLDLPFKNKPIVAMETIRLCTIHHQHKRCNNSLIEEITSLHKDDSQIWNFAILYYASTNQDDKVFMAMEQAQQGKYSSSHYYQYISTHNQILEGAGIGNYISNTVGALGTYFAKAIRFDALTNWCFTNMHKDANVQACLSFTKHWEKSTSDTLDALIALRIQEKIYELESNPKAIAHVKDRLKNVSAYSSHLSNSKISNTVLFHEKLLRDFHSRYELLGEHGSMRALEEEYHGFKDPLGYQLCSEVYED